MHWWEFEHSTLRVCSFSLPTSVERGFDTWSEAARGEGPSLSLLSVRLGRASETKTMNDVVDRRGLEGVRVKLS